MSKTDYERQKANDCIIQHIHTFHEQSKYDSKADFGEPCRTCPYNGECNFDWLSVMKPLLDQSKIKIDMLLDTTKMGIK